MKQRKKIPSIYRWQVNKKISTTTVLFTKHLVDTWA